MLRHKGLRWQHLAGMGGGTFTVILGSVGVACSLQQLTVGKGRIQQTGLILLIILKQGNILETMVNTASCSGIQVTTRGTFLTVNYVKSSLGNFY